MKTNKDNNDFLVNLRYDNLDKDGDIIPKAFYFLFPVAFYVLYYLPVLYLALRAILLIEQIIGLFM